MPSPKGFATRVTLTTTTDALITSCDLPPNSWEYPPTPSQTIGNVESRSTLRSSALHGEPILTCGPLRALSAVSLIGSAQPCFRQAPCSYVQASQGSSGQSGPSCRVSRSGSFSQCKVFLRRLHAGQSAARRIVPIAVGAMPRLRPVSATQW